MDKRHETVAKTKQLTFPPVAGLWAALSGQSAREGDDLFLKVSLRGCAAINKTI